MVRRTTAREGRGREGKSAQMYSAIPNGHREPDLGSTAHPRGTAQARFRHLGTNRLSLGQTRSRTPDPVRRWLAFLRNHREAIAAMDFFTVPTLTFGVLYCFFVIDHDRRKILHLNVTRNPTSFWVALQLRQTWGYDQPHRFLIFDRDAKSNVDVVATVKDHGILPIRTAFRSPWQNGVAERWVGSVRRDFLNHLIVLNQPHLRRLLRDYIRYYHDDRTHLGLEKDTPGGRTTAVAAEQGRVAAATRWIAPPLRNSGLSQLHPASPYVSSVALD